MARAGVHITEYGGTQVNPEPISIPEPEHDAFLEDYISPTKLRALTGIEDLEDVKFLEMKVDTSETSLGNFGAMLPNLKQLKLNDSLIASVRDLGTALDNLTVLWMAKCCLCDLDGLSSMSALKELYLAYNDVTDISPCSMLECLQLLDLEGNNIDDVAQVEFLGLCSKLRALTLEGNPVCLAPSKDCDQDKSGPYNYRASVWKAVPQLQMLDDEVLDHASTSTSSLRPKALNLSTDWLIVNNSIKDSLGSVESVNSDDSGGPRPKTAARPGSASGRRPSSGSRRPGSSWGNRPGTSAGARPMTAAERPDTGGSDINADNDDTSGLTHGSHGVICGNPVKALRNRRKNNKNPMVPQSTTLFMLLQHRPEHTYDMPEEDDPDDGKSKEDIFADLRTWKAEHERRVESRLKDLEPQVLTITHSDEEEGTNNDNLPGSSGQRHKNDDFDVDDDDEDVDIGVYIPPTPTESPVEERMPTPPRAPKSPVKGPVRPKTSIGDYRVRRFRQRSFDESTPVDLLPSRPPSMEERSSSLDDSGHISPGAFRATFSNSPVLARLEDRPYSGPAATMRTMHAELAVDKNSPKSIDPHRPIIRSSIHTPPNRFMGLISRPVTAKAALQRNALPPRTKKNMSPSM
ncbi:leucine-rich repeat-containing protein 56-like [Diadema setosum]|uniref:leucine-rich repeat-containing protein 56-like n=1 Tax=Diadema setosum TaxID=31175 RepID=UPI003B3A8AB0